MRELNDVDRKQTDKGDHWIDWEEGRGEGRDGGVTLHFNIYLRGLDTKQHCNLAELLFILCWVATPAPALENCQSLLPLPGSRDDYYHTSQG